MQPLVQSDGSATLQQAKADANEAATKANEQTSTMFGNLQNKV